MQVATDVNIRAIIDRHKNRNGCNMPATFFVLKQDTDCDLARKFWEQNSEVRAAAARRREGGRWGQEAGGPGGSAGRRHSTTTSPPEPRRATQLPAPFERT